MYASVHWAMVKATLTIQYKHNQPKREKLREWENKLLSHSFYTHTYHNIHKLGKYGSRSHVDIVIVASLFLLHMLNVCFKSGFSSFFSLYVVVVVYSDFPSSIWIKTRNEKISLNKTFICFYEHFRDCHVAKLA